MTRPLSRPYIKKHLRPLNNCLGRRTSTLPRMSGLRTSLEAQSLYRPRCEGTQTSNQTKAGRRDPMRRCTPPGHLLLKTAAHPAEGYEHWTRSIPSARTTRTCGTPCGTAGISKTLLGTTDHSSNLTRLEESLMSLGSLNNRKGERWSFPSR
jgi:hypothetical protein